MYAEIAQIKLTTKLADTNLNKAIEIFSINTFYMLKIYNFLVTDNIFFPIIQKNG